MKRERDHELAALINSLELTGHGYKIERISPKTGVRDTGDALHSWLIDHKWSNTGTIAAVVYRVTFGSPATTVFGTDLIDTLQELKDTVEGKPTS